jgi:hypothetical protein
MLCKDKLKTLLKLAGKDSNGDPDARLQQIVEEMVGEESCLDGMLVSHPLVFCL